MHHLHHHVLVRVLCTVEALLTHTPSVTPLSYGLWESMGFRDVTKNRPKILIKIRRKKTLSLICMTEVISNLGCSRCLRSLQPYLPSKWCQNHLKLVCNWIIHVFNISVDEARAMVETLTPLFLRRLWVDQLDAWLRALGQGCRSVLHEKNAKIKFISMGFESHKGYVLWGITDVWVINQVSPHTRLVTWKMYGVRESMGYRSYGLRGLRL